MFPQRNIHQYTWGSPQTKTRNQVDHILIGRRRHSSIVDERFYTDHYLVAAKVREKLAKSKQQAQKFDVKRFNLRKLSVL